MAQNYYNVEQAAKVLGVTPDAVRQMRERNELHGYRDGANWKFKSEDVERIANARNVGTGDDDLLLDDSTINQTATGGSSAPAGPGSSGASGIAFAALDSGVHSGPGSSAARGPESDLKLVDEDILDSRPAMKPGKGSDASNALGGKDDLVLAPSGIGSGSDIADSGIALIDPRDSGLALDEPIDLGPGGDDEGLQLGEDDLLVGKDDDFLLTPLTGGDEDDAESGSQVIALDSEPLSEDAATIIGTPSKANLVAMLDEDLAPPGLGGLAVAPSVSPGGMGGLGGIPAGAAIGAAAMSVGGELAAPIEALPEEPYSVWQVLGLSVALVVMVFACAMMYDVMRNMWSWGTPYEVNSSLMDWLVKMVEGK